MRKHEQDRQRRLSVYLLLTLATLSIAVGRMSVVIDQRGVTAMQSANDRSRWCTVASLVERGTYAIDEQIAIRYRSDPKHRPWDTIDKVRHLGPDGELHYYSSKPALFPTMVAGLYKVVNLFSGMTLTQHPVYVPRLLTILVNLPLLAVFLFCTIDAVDRSCRSDWGRLVIAVFTCFGVLVLPFSLVLNNHLPAAAATALALWVYVYVAEKKHDLGPRVGWNPPWEIWTVAGFAAAFAAANELPALAMLVFWFLLFRRFDRSSVLPFVGGVAVVVIAFFATNWLAHRSLLPPYAHRGDGSVIARLSDQASRSESVRNDEILETLGSTLEFSPDAALTIRSTTVPNRQCVAIGPRQFALLSDDDGYSLAHWNDWYDYPGTYWSDEGRQGLDRGEPSRLVYLLQMTIGHHGVFSLTPMWLLLPLGLLRGWRRGTREYRRLSRAIAIVSVTCLLFYLARPLVDRNYGGVSVAFRWLLWLTPLWIFVIAPRLERYTRNQAKPLLIYVLLAMSIYSVGTALDSPWEHPWLYRIWTFLGWIDV